MTIINFFYIAVCVCTFVAYYVIASLPGNKTGILFGMNYNLVCYVLMVGGLYIIFLLLILLYKRRKQIATLRKPASLTERNSWMVFVASGVLLLCGAAFLFKIYLNENYVYPYWSAADFIRSKVNKTLYAAIICLLYISFVLISKNSGCSRFWGRILLGLFVAGLCATLVYAPNPYLDDEGRGLYHIHAYTNSIINIARLKPFNRYNLSIYGHYALLYLPLVKIFGNNYTAVAISISVFTFVSYLCTFCVCERTIKNDLCYVITVLAISAVSVMFYLKAQYYQVVPQRVLFPSITICYITLSQQGRFQPKRQWIIETILGSVALIWNFETGLFSIITLTFYHAVCTFHERRSLCRTLAGCLFLAIGNYAVAYLTVNLYNFLTGAETWMSWKRFIYPIGSDSYSIDALRLPLPTPYTLFSLQLMIFSVTLVNMVFQLREKRPEEYIRSRILLSCIAVSGLGSLSYFVNRPAYANISISCTQMLIIAGIYGDEVMCELRSISFQKRLPRQSIFPASGKSIMLLLVFILAVESVLSVDNAISRRIDMIWNTQARDQFVFEESELISNNTLGMGIGVPELFFQLGRDPGCVLLDWSDMDEVNLEKALSVIENHNGDYLINDAHYAIVEKGGLEIIDENPFGEYLYLLCRKKTDYS